MSATSHAALGGSRTVDEPVIEFRAEIGFAETQTILRSPDVFTDRRAEAETAAEIVERIRTDERCEDAI